ncbi:MAG: hypothetical protein U0871_07680 [Gemmataceae bacterium]
MPVVLADDALYAESYGHLRTLPLAEVTAVARRRRWVELATAGPPLAVKFGSRVQAEEWAGEVRAALARPPAAPAQASDADHVVLLPAADGVRYQTLGGVSYTAADRGVAETAVKVQAALLGADAVIHATETRLPGYKPRWRAAGTAVRAADTNGRRDLYALWYGSRLAAVGGQLLVLLAVYLALRLACTGCLSLVPLGRIGALPGLVDVPAEVVGAGPRMEFVVTAVAAAGAVELVALALLVWLRRAAHPDLLRPALLAAAVMLYWPPVTTLAEYVRAMWLAPAGGVGATTARHSLVLLSLVDPVNWAFWVVGAVLLRRAAQIGREARPRLRAMDGPTRVGWVSVVGWGVAGVYVAARAAVLADALILAPVPDPPAPLVTPDDRRPAHPGDDALARGADALNRGAAKMAADPAAARELFVESARRSESVPASHPLHPLARVNLFTARANIGLCDVMTGRPAAAGESLQSALALFGGLPVEVKRQPEVVTTAAACHTFLAVVALTDGKAAGAEPEARTALALLATVPQSDRRDLLRSEARFRLVFALGDLDRVREAGTECRAGIEEFAAATPAVRANPETRRQHALLHVVLGLALTAEGKKDTAAEKARATGVELLERLAVERPTDPDVRAALEMARQPLRPAD